MGEADCCGGGSGDYCVDCCACVDFCGGGSGDYCIGSGSLCVVNGSIVNGLSFVDGSCARVVDVDGRVAAEALTAMTGASKATVGAV